MFPSVSLPQSSSTLEKFDEWNEEKKKIHKKDIHEVYINPRDIWYVKMGINIGNETNGKGEFVRPVLILKRVGNLVFVAPLTTKGKESNFYHILSTVKYLDTQYARNISRVELSQCKMMDKKRFLDKIGSIDSTELWDIKKKLIKLLL
jgi:mRNA interferase MazF